MLLIRKQNMTVKYKIKCLQTIEFLTYAEFETLDALLIKRKVLHIIGAKHVKILFKILKKH